MNFTLCINRLLQNEGDLSDNKNDPGKLTRWGISQRSYPTLDIRNLTKESAIAIYKRDFWDLIDLDEAPLGISNQLLDFAVNSGVQTALRALQRAVGVADDGIIGQHTKDAIAKMQDHDIVMRLIAERLIFMTNCQGWLTFGKGWARRIASELRFGAEDD